MEEKPKTKYTEAQKRATKKYRDNNKDKVNEQRKKYYQSRKDKDPSFLEYKRNKAKEYYAKKKEINKAIKEKIEEHRLKSKDVDEIEKIKEEVKQNIDKKDIVIDIPVIDETVQEKKKRKYNKLNKTI